MQPIRRDDTTRVLGESQGYTPLPVSDMLGNNGDLDGTPMMLSQWKPSPQERADIAAGKDIWLWVLGTAHPPVMVTVED